MKKVPHYDPKIVEDEELKREQIRQAQKYALDMMQDDSPELEEEEPLDHLRGVSPGNRKYFRDELNKVRDESEKLRFKNGEYNLDGSLNLEGIRENSALWKEADKRLMPLSREIDMQQQAADNENDLKKRIKYEALKRMLSGIKE